MTDTDTSDLAAAPTEHTPLTSGTPKVAKTSGMGTLISGIIALVLSQATLYLFIFTVVLNTLSILAIVFSSILFGLTLFAAGLAIIFGHRDLKTKTWGAGKRPGRVLMGLVFGYGTLLVLAVTVLLSVLNMNALNQTSNMRTVCVQQTHALNCKTE